MIKLSDNNSTAISLPWFPEEDYLAFCAMCAERRTWKEHKKLYAEREAFYKGLGHAIKRIEIDTDEFANWCREKGIPINADASVKFAAEKTRNYQN